MSVSNLTTLLRSGDGDSIPGEWTVMPVEHAHPQPASQEQQALGSDSSVPVPAIILFPCEVKGCRRKYLRKGDLKVHLKNNHADVCESAIESLKIVPSKTKPFQCKVESCDRTFWARKDLLRHIRIKHPEKQQESSLFHCEVKSCNRTFKYLGNLDRHMIMEH